MADNTTDLIHNDMKALTTDEMDGKFLTFWMDKRSFGIPIKDVVQIVGVQDITVVPEFPHYAKGIMNLRGSIIPVIDVRLRFGIPEIEYTERTCIIVTSIKDKLIGFIVDSVDEVTSINDDMISPPPDIGDQHRNSYITGVGRHNDRVVLLLDTSRMLDDGDFSALTASY